MFDYILKEERIDILWLGAQLGDLKTAFPDELRGKIKIAHANRPDQAVEYLGKHKFQVLVIQLSKEDFAPRFKWLREFATETPGMIRIMLNDQLQMHQIAKASELCHRSILFRSGIRELLHEISQCIRLIQTIHKPAVSEFVGSIQRLPSMPGIYMELNDALASDATGAAEIAEIIEKDPAISAKVLQLVNSAFFALSSHVFKIKDAVVILGVRQIRDLFLVSRLFEQYPQESRWKGFSFENLFDRSMVVARFARAICRDHRVSVEIADKAFLAALLQDIGMLVLATKDADIYSDVMRESAQLDQPLYAVEKMRLGVTHMEVGAYILGVWNLPPEVVEAVLYHSHPNATAAEKFTPLTAVHLADSILPDVINVNDCQICSRLSETYVRRLGLQDNLHHWQQMSEDYASQLYSGVGQGF